MNSAILEAPTARSTSLSEASRRLQHTMAAAKLSFTWLGVRKSLTVEQKNQAADSFGAEGKFLSAGKKLLDTSHPAFKAVTAIKGRCLSYWRAVSLPFPEPGIRLIRQHGFNDFDKQMASFRAELTEAVEELDQKYAELRTAARHRLGDLFDPSDYPISLIGLFGIEHEYPSVEPPNYLRQLHPELYEQECQRMQARFDEAVALAEQAFIEEISRLVEHLVQRAQKVLRGVEPQQLRDNNSLRQRLGSQLSSIQSSLDGLMVDRPRRNILRKPR